jgi:hypothetical protein
MDYMGMLILSSIILALLTVFLLGRPQLMPGGQIISYLKD